MKFAYLFILPTLVVSCQSNTKSNQYSVIDEGIENSFHHIDLVDNSTQNKISFYFDNENNLVQMNNNNEKYFKVTFDQDEGVNYVENKKSETESERFWLEEENGNDLLIEKIHFPFKSRVYIYDKFCPKIENYTTINLKNNWFLQEYRIFDFRSMKIIPSETSEYIQLLNRPIKEEVGKEGVYKFKVISRFNNRYLLRGKFKDDFTSFGKVDTIHVSDIFEFKYTPISKLDTIRFIIHHDGKIKDEKMGKSIYYQLPVKIE